MTTLQQQIIAELGVKPDIDGLEEFRRSVRFLKQYLQKHDNVEALVLGLSLGQDSTLTGKCAQVACDELNLELGRKKYRFIGVRLPYGIQADEQDAEAVMSFIRPDVVLSVNIKEAVDASAAAVEAAIQAPVSDFLKGNMKARHRMEVQYTIAGHYKGVVLGTDHAAEAVTGFYTKFGDGAADLTPIFRLNKRQGRRILELLGCPERLYRKTPTADLEGNRPQLPDEDALGVTYDQIDDYLEGKLVPEQARLTIEGWYVRTKHKRKPPITVFDDWWK
ncbi:NH(3)-dependent NAD(+) synthetase [Paenibacillus konkukensis]|uniref:NH(3)-dependent NAD(+) synthetase n=1 Tax=Paenibacillus konkukensis TaxID=2020716 RepID=A0ABY4RIF8_9BACL|nr:ammonia-dependent NAD(+) synthetase [Paenibacillus konkukensis]UQZ81298.1 NH(3)-dependent NAD(+) synthetase [Paenibacillus konkukensis]